MTGPAYLALRYSVRHKYKTALLVLSLTLVFYIPAGLRVLVRQSQERLIARARATPLLIGAKGSPLELVLKSLYFRADVPETIAFGESEAIARSGFATALPLYVRFRSEGDPIAGVTLDYFQFRGLKIASGAQMTRLGDCVIGAAVARRRSLKPGSSVISSPESVFDVAGVYPLKMRVTGVLAPSGGPDDEAIFTDVKTAWIIQGLAHGHDDLSRPEAAGAVLERRGPVVVGSAAVVEYNEITSENIGSFHFHGDPSTFPVSAIIAVPHDQKSAALLMGRYQSSQEQPLQIVEPQAVMEELMTTVFTVEGYVVAALAMVGIAALATAALVFLLSLQLRRREIQTMVKIGGAQRRIGAMVALEVFGVLSAAVALAATLTGVTAVAGPGLLQRILMAS